MHPQKHHSQPKWPTIRCPVTRSVERAVLLEDWPEAFRLIESGASESIQGQLGGWILRQAIFQRRPGIVMKIVALGGDDLSIEPSTHALAMEIDHPIILQILGIMRTDDE